MSNSSHTQKKKQKKAKIKRTINRVKVYYTDEIIPIVDNKPEEDSEFDPCPICAFDLSYSNDKTQRVALLDGNDNIDGWMCPECTSRFSLKDELESLGVDIKLTKT